MSRTVVLVCHQDHCTARDDRTEIKMAASVVVQFQLQVQLELVQEDLDAYVKENEQLKEREQQLIDERDKTQQDLVAARTEVS